MLFQSTKNLVRPGARIAVLAAGILACAGMDAGSPVGHFVNDTSETLIMELHHFSPFGHESLDYQPKPTEWMTVTRQLGDSELPEVQIPLRKSLWRRIPTWCEQKQREAELPPGEESRFELKAIAPVPPIPEEPKLAVGLVVQPGCRVTFQPPAAAGWMRVQASFMLRAENAIRAATKGLDLNWAHLDVAWSRVRTSSLSLPEDQASLETSLLEDPLPELEVVMNPYFYEIDNSYPRSRGAFRFTQAGPENGWSLGPSPSLFKANCCTIL